MAEKRRGLGRGGLGRGIAALIPENQKENKNSPIDVFFTKPNKVAAENETANTEVKNTSNFIKNDDSQNKENNDSKQKTIKSNIEEEKSVNLHKKSAKKNENEFTDNKKTRQNSRNTNVDNSGKISNSQKQQIKESFITEKESPDNSLLPIPGVTFGEIPLTQIVPNTKQPRQIFDEEDLEELSASIKEVGVLQPIVVRPLNKLIKELPEARYELIMGERRWRASQLAGKDTVPAIVRRTEDEDLLRDALLENLHRAQLNALEEAAAYQQLLEDFNCTQEELSRKIARSRPQISNTLRLLKLPSLVQRRVASGVLSAGHARALLGLPDPAAMERVAQRIVAEGLSVRATEEIVAIGESAETKPERRLQAKESQPELAELANRLGDRLDTRVNVQMGVRKGKITIDFASIEDLNRILEILGETHI